MQISCSITHFFHVIETFRISFTNSGKKLAIVCLFSKLRKFRYDSLRKRLLITDLRRETSYQKLIVHCGKRLPRESLFNKYISISSPYVEFHFWLFIKRYGYVSRQDEQRAIQRSSRETVNWDYHISNDWADRLKTG
jgi:hypothetical protein